MNRIRIYTVSFILSLVMSLGLTGYPGDTETARLIDSEIAKLKDDFIKIRRIIHMNPELGNREYETGKLVASKLMALGLEVQTGIAHTGVVALLRGGNPGITVGCRADMDALPIQEATNLPYQSLNPGVMHACGHDIHTTIVLGTAMVLNSMKNRLKGNIKFIFQPAEEGPPPGEEGGAELMIKQGVLDNPPLRAIFGLHVMPIELGHVQYAPGAIMASPTWFEIVIKGQSAHGARPHEGKDAITLAAQVVLSIQTIVSRNIEATDPAVISIGKIEGGNRSNIIAAQVRLEGTIRTLSDANRKTILGLMEEVVKGTTHAFGADYSFHYSIGPPPVYNHPDLAKIMLPTLYQVAGEAFVEPTLPLMVSEDFAYYCQRIPGFFFFLGVKSPSSESMAPLHSPSFNPDERSIPQGIKVMSHLLINSLEHQSQKEDTT
ncbi:MAG: amidohydrolase [Candidatus Aminicenantes bacterium]|nr:amidohydrolase [Candidatus Aminicenantes bacterium]